MLFINLQILSLTTSGLIIAFEMALQSLENMCSKYYLIRVNHTLEI
jgi:hypothetical protein